MKNDLDASRIVPAGPTYRPFNGPLPTPEEAQERWPGDFLIAISVERAASGDATAEESARRWIGKAIAREQRSEAEKERERVELAAQSRRDSRFWAEVEESMAKAQAAAEAAESNTYGMEFSSAVPKLVDGFVVMYDGDRRMIYMTLAAWSARRRRVAASKVRCVPATCEPRKLPAIDRASRREPHASANAAATTTTAPASSPSSDTPSAEPGEHGEADDPPPPPASAVEARYSELTDPVPPAVLTVADWIERFPARERLHLLEGLPDEVGEYLAREMDSLRLFAGVEVLRCSYCLSPIPNGATGYDPKYGIRRMEVVSCSACAHALDEAKEVRP